MMFTNFCVVVVDELVSKRDKFNGCRVSKYSEFLGSDIHHGFLVKTTRLADLGISVRKQEYLLDGQLPTRAKLVDELKALGSEVNEDDKVVMKMSVDNYR